ncbi:1-acyl-sn-glycerol-3-phosphate acyltransferase [Phaeobacter sp.]|uniref:lysophospholipid acyltransferase family protein n=1 Tax=Phaeobacter sp. TaxID=1902409 RepID=UPI002600C02D|nr:lysophospholipid acyltransferase family protein [Phaeobacter sp.]
MTTWHSNHAPARPSISAAGWVRVLVRGLCLGVLVFGGLALLLLLRLIERPLFGIRRPITPWITQVVCRSAFRIMGMGFHHDGEKMVGPGAVVANHTSWLDIFALNARQRIYFVSKAEVAKWPGIGWLARATGTVFIERNARQAQQQTRIFQDRLMAGHKLLFFPEGTSTDGHQVLAFKTTLFAAFFAPELREHMQIQPVSVVFTPPKGADPRFYGWWGDMDFGSHFLQTLAGARQGAVTLRYHTPLRVADFPDRKSLARACEVAVRDGHRDLQGYDLKARVGREDAV